ncbi:MAG: hypothetical protein RBS01_01725 [Candidatus Dojkabacteria bacterium]|jgi:hypothetical protein|nr:hypothetical protein [Candidatus Dojkabacteria bacterium]
MAEKITTSKIVVEKSHELTDIVRDLHKSKADRIVLTFTEQTDLLISPINLKVLEEAAQREGKLLIAQIIQNPTGIRNAKLAGMKVIDTPSAPTEYDWEEAVELIAKKKESKLEKKKEIEEVIPEESNKEVFEERIKSSLEENGNKKYVDKRGVKPVNSFISIDQDLPNNDIPTAKISPNRELRAATQPPEIKKRRINIFNKLKSLNKKSLLRIALFGIIPLFAIIVIGLVLYNQFATIAKVKIFVEAKPVEVELILTGDEDTQEIDLEDLTIPIKVEESTQSLSDSITATGKAFKGEKAKGDVTITFYRENGCGEETEKPKVTLNVGHIVTTPGYTFKTTTVTEFLCNQMATITLEAAEIGEQYNVSDGKPFRVKGYTEEEGFDGDLTGVNSEPFTGGSKEEYTVLSQLDVDNAVEQLSTTAIEEVKSDLREKNQGWEIIEDTILSEVDDESIKTDKKVGEEAETANLDLTIKGSATYYSTTGLTEALTQLLREQAEEENLFESDKDLELVLGDDLDIDISIEESAKDVVKIKIVAKSNIKPKIDKTELENTLRGMSWEEGKEYADNLKYAERKSEISFTPNNYPAFLKRFPDRRGGVMVTITELEVDK